MPRRMMWSALFVPTLSLSSLATMLAAGTAPRTEDAVQSLALVTPTETPPGAAQGLPVVLTVIPPPVRNE